MVLVQMDGLLGKKVVEPYLTIYARMHSRWIENLNVGSEKNQRSRNKVKFTCDLRVGKPFITRLRKELLSII